MYLGDSALEEWNSLRCMEPEVCYLSSSLERTNFEFVTGERVSVYKLFLSSLTQSRQNNCSCFSCPWKQQKLVGAKPAIPWYLSLSLSHTSARQFLLGMLVNGMVFIHGCCFTKGIKCSCLGYPRTPAGLVVLHVSWGGGFRRSGVCSLSWCVTALIASVLSSQLFSEPSSFKLGCLNIFFVFFLQLFDWGLLIWQHPSLLCMDMVIGKHAFQTVFLGLYFPATWQMFLNKKENSAL